MLYAATRTGAVRWRFNTGDRVYSTPAVTDEGRLYLGTDADRFLSVSARGRLNAALATEADADTSPVIARDGTVRFAAGRTLYSVDPDFTVRWRLDVGGKIFSSPALGDDGTAYCGSQDDHVYAVDANGEVRWRFAAGDDVDATPMLDGQGNLYVGSDDGNVYALSREGQERWRRAVGGFVRAGAALGLDGTVIVATYGPRARIVALDRGNGREVWTYAIGGPPTREYGIASAPLVDADGRIAFGAPDDALHLVDRDGTHPTRVPLPGDVDSAPVLLDDRLVAVGCDDGTLYLIGE
jgi:outer membrane protein assembly factor BamB